MDIVIRLYTALSAENRTGVISPTLCLSGLALLVLPMIQWVIIFNPQPELLIDIAVYPEICFNAF